MNPDNTFFTADFHFDHKNIIKYCNRPFSAVEEMNAVMLSNYNAVVTDDSFVFFLGDMAFGRDSRPPRYWLKQLRGHIVYVKGSHDHGIRPTSVLEGASGPVEVVASYVLDTGCGEVYLVHDFCGAPQDWQRRRWVLHGHNHANRPFIDVRQKRINVGVDVTGFKPVSLTQVRAAVVAARKV